MEPRWCSARALLFLLVGVAIACSPSATSPSGPPAVGEPSTDAGAHSADAGADGTSDARSRCEPGPDAIGESASFIGLDTEIEAALAKHHVAGVAVAIVKRKTTVFARGYGIAARDGAKQTARSVHLIASASKPVTTIAILQLVEAGKLGIDDDVNDVLAGLPLSVRNPAHPRKPITVRSLLTHTSTIVDAAPYWDTSFYSRGDPKISTKEFVAGYFTPGKANYGGSAAFLGDKPGAISCYSNIGVGLLSLVVEAASNTPFAEYAKTNIFDVLGMFDTSFLIADQCDPKRLVENLKWSGGQFTLDHYGAEGQPENHPELASGMLRTTALDMARYVAALENDGELDGRRVLSAMSAKEMKRRQLSANLPSCNARTVAGDQGLLAYWTKDSVDEYFGHAGGMKGVGADVFYRTSDGAGFVVLGNVASDAWVNDVEIALLTAANKL